MHSKYPKSGIPISLLLPLICNQSREAHLSINLSEYQPGESCRILRLAQSELSPKLVEMGLYEGQVLKVLFKAPFGDPIAVDVGGYILSLRRDEASLIYVERVSKTPPKQAIPEIDVQDDLNTGELRQQITSKGIAGSAA
jgi:Fe2+ transport system protein FeoA